MISRYRGFSRGPDRIQLPDKTTLQKRAETYHLAGEQPGVSVFLRDEEDHFSIYSTYGRPDLLDGTYNY
jgi:hypothetical protein